MSEQQKKVVTPPSPGQVLRDLIGDLGGVTQEELAEALGVSRYSVNQLVNGRRNVTAEMALRLSKAFGTSPEFWLNLQRSLDLHQARESIANQLSHVPVLRESTPEEELFYSPE